MAPFFIADVLALLIKYSAQTKQYLFKKAIKDELLPQAYVDPNT